MRSIVVCSVWCFFFFPSRRRHTRCALVSGVQTCALPIFALGESMLDKHRYTDAANANAAFIQRYPASPLAPTFQTRVIAAYEAGGFNDLVLKEKERYVATYDPSAPYWRGQPATPGVMAALRRHHDGRASCKASMVSFW